MPEKRKRVYGKDGKYRGTLKQKDVVSSVVDAYAVVD